MLTIINSKENFLHAMSLLWIKISSLLRLIELKDTLINKRQFSLSFHNMKKSSRKIRAPWFKWKRSMRASKTIFSIKKFKKRALWLKILKIWLKRSKTNKMSLANLLKMESLTTSRLPHRTTIRDKNTKRFIRNWLVFKRELRTLNMFLTKIWKKRLN